MSNFSRRGAEARNIRACIRSAPPTLWLLSALLIFLTGCKPKDIEVAPPAVADNATTRGQLIAAQNDRAARLATTCSDGVIELRWEDDKGEHTDQGDIELWQTTGNRTAARISKLGEDLFWLGSMDEQWWLFDLTTKGDRVLYRGTHEQVGERLAGLGVRPLALLDLMGLTAIAADPAGEARPLGIEKTGKALRLEARGRGGPLRYEFDATSLLPTSIQLLDTAGAVIAASTLSRFESVPAPNTAIMARPKMPRTIDIQLQQAGEGGIVGDVKISFNQTVGEIDPKQLAQIFDLERLIAALRPDRVDEAAAP